MKNNLVSVIYAGLLGMAMATGAGAEEPQLLQINSTNDWAGKWRTEEQLRTVTRDGDVVFEATGDQRLNSAGSLTIETNAVYKLSGYFRAKPGTKPGKLYFGVMPFDEKKMLINSPPINVITNSDTELLAPCRKDDKKLVVKNAAGWKTSDGAMVAFDIKDDYGDLPNRKLSESGINNIRKTDNGWEIELKGICRFDFPAGTRLREHISGGNYLYAAVCNLVTPAEWKYFEGKVSGMAKYGLPQDQWWAGTKQGGIVILANYQDKQGESVTQFKAVKLEKISGAAR